MQSGTDMIQVREDYKIDDASTALEDDLFLPRGYYKMSDGVPYTFDFGCTHAVTPFTSDFKAKLRL